MKKKKVIEREKKKLIKDFEDFGVDMKPQKKKKKKKKKKKRKA